MLLVFTERAAAIGEGYGLYRSPPPASGGNGFEVTCSNTYEREAAIGEGLGLLRSHPPASGETRSVQLLGACSLLIKFKKVCQLERRFSAAAEIRDPRSEV